MRRSSIAALTLLTGCVNHAVVSSGQIGCAPDDIAITDESTGVSGQSWTATCAGKKYRCSAVGGLSHTACTRDQGDETATDDAPPAPAVAVEKGGHISGPTWSFDVPDSFRGDVAEGHKVYRPANNWGTVVFLDVATFEGTADEFARQQYPARELKKVALAGQDGVVAIANDHVFKRKMRVATMVVVAQGDAYALTCADSNLEELSDRCKTVLRSLRTASAK